MIVLVLLKRSVAFLSPIPSAVVAAPNPSIGRDIEIGPLSVLLMEPAIHVPPQPQIERQTVVHLEIVRSKRGHSLPASISSRGHASRAIMHLSEHEVGKSKAHEGQYGGIVWREGLAPKVVGPHASVIQPVHATRLKIASKLKVV